MEDWLSWLRSALERCRIRPAALTDTPDTGRLPHGTSSTVLAISAALALSAGVAVPMILRGLKLRSAKVYEYGDLDITQMTPQAAKELHKKDASKDETARGGKALNSIWKAASSKAGKMALAAKGFHAKERTSLIPDALEDLEEQGAQLAADAMAPADEVDQRAKALAAVGAPPFKRFLKEHSDVPQELARGVCQTLQLNIGIYCNQACTHCHVESSPLRKEMMELDVVDRCLHLIRNSPHVNCLDITGGAPELNKGFQRLIEGAAQIRDSGLRPDLRIIDRCNLTVLLEPGQEKLADYLALHRVDIIASLPSYDEKQTDNQRGRKVFKRSIEALRILNELGYGNGSTAKDALRLDLVFNPPGPFLPPKQELLEAKYHKQLTDEHSVRFDNLITITNMPVKRFFDFLRKKGTLEGYMDLLVRNFNPETVPHLMCINTVNVGWDGKMYDCDFNQQLDFQLGGSGKTSGLTVFGLESLDDPVLRKAPIMTAAHCFGCTAAQGSS